MKQVPVALGSLWPEEGGYYIGNIFYPNGDIYALIIASKETEFTSIFNEVIEDSDTVGDLYDGYKNSQMDFTIFSNLVEINKDEHKDWYLFSRAELNICWENNNTLELEQQFEKNWYWSSSWYSSGYAWLQYFDTGTQYNCLQFDTYRGRAGRKVKLN